jgi:hypothetical protein
MSINENLQIVFVIAMYILVVIPIISFSLNAMIDDFITYLLDRKKRKEQEENESKRRK